MAMTLIGVADIRCSSTLLAPSQWSTKPTRLACELGVEDCAGVRGGAIRTDESHWRSQP